MALIIPRWGFKYHASRWTQLGLTGATPAGVSVTSGAANTKGSTTAVLTAVAFDVHCLAVSIAANNVAGAVRSSLVDVMWDPAGGTTWHSAALIPNLLFAQETAIGLGIPHQHIYIFPIYVRTGASFGARHQNSSASAAVNISMWVWGEPSQPALWWCGAGVESLGVSTGTSLGTSHTPGNATFGTLTTIGTSTARYGAYQFGLGANDSTIQAAKNVVSELVYSTGAYMIGSCNHHVSYSTGESAGYAVPYHPQWCNFPSGTSFAVRAYATVNSPADTFAYSIHGVY